MTKPEDIQQIVDAELAKGETFTNFHGITAENLESFLVTPYEISVYPDDTPPAYPRRRSMWVVLKEFFKVSASPDDEDPDDEAVDPQESEPRSMWVVLEEFPGDARRGYVVVYNPSAESWPWWELAEPTRDGRWMHLVAADSPADALTSM